MVLRRKRWMREMELQLWIPKEQRQEREDIGKRSSINNSILKYIYNLQKQKLQQHLICIIYRHYALLFYELLIFFCSLELSHCVDSQQEFKSSKNEPNTIEDDFQQNTKSLSDWKFHCTYIFAILGKRQSR